MKFRGAKSRSHVYYKNKYKTKRQEQQQKKHRDKHLNRKRMRSREKDSENLGSFIVIIILQGHIQCKLLYFELLMLHIRVFKLFCLLKCMCFSLKLTAIFLK